MTPNLERDGYAILLGAVPAPAITAALRCIGLGIRRHGLPGGQAHADCGTFLPELRDDPAIWRLLPTGRWAKPGDSWVEPQILLRFPDEAPARRRTRMSTFEEDDFEEPARPAHVRHVDEEPPWAGHEYVQPRHSAQGPCVAGGRGQRCHLPASDPIHVRPRRYRAIVGVTLTDHGPDDGALHVWPGSHLSLLWPDGSGRRDRVPVAVPLKAGDAVVMHPKLAHAWSPNLGSTWQACVCFRLLGPA